MELELLDDAGPAVEVTVDQPDEDGQVLIADDALGHALFAARRLGAVDASQDGRVGASGVADQRSFACADDVDGRGGGQHDGGVALQHFEQLRLGRARVPAAAQQARLDMARLLFQLALELFLLHFEPLLGPGRRQRFFVFVLVALFVAQVTVRDQELVVYLQASPKNSSFSSPRNSVKLGLRHFATEHLVPKL